MLCLKKIAAGIILFVSFAYAIQTPELFIYIHGATKYTEVKINRYPENSPHSVDKKLHYGEYDANHPLILQPQNRNFFNVLKVGLLTSIVLLFICCFTFGIFGPSLILLVRDNDAKERNYL